MPCGMPPGSICAPAVQSATAACCQPPQSRLTGGRGPSQAQRHRAAHQQRPPPARRGWCMSDRQTDRQTHTHTHTHTQRDPSLHLHIAPHVGKPRPKGFKHKMPRNKPPLALPIITRLWALGCRAGAWPAATSQRRGFGGLGKGALRRALVLPHRAQPCRQGPMGPCSRVGLVEELLKSSGLNTSSGKYVYMETYVKSTWRHMQKIYGDRNCTWRHRQTMMRHLEAGGEHTRPTLCTAEPIRNPPAYLPHTRPYGTCVKALSWPCGKHLNDGCWPVGRLWKVAQRLPLEQAVFAEPLRCV